MGDAKCLIYCLIQFFTIQGATNCHFLPGKVAVKYFLVPKDAVDQKRLKNTVLDSISLEYLLYFLPLTLSPSLLFAHSLPPTPPSLSLTHSFPLFYSISPTLFSPSLPLSESELRQSFSTYVYCMQLRIQSNYLGLSQPT